MKKIAICLAFVISCFVAASSAQPRIVEKKPAEKSQAVLAPVSFAA